MATAFVVIVNVLLLLLVQDGSTAKSAAELMTDVYSQPKYQLNFPDTPVRLQELAASTSVPEERRLRLTSPNGQRFVCELPDLQSEADTDQTVEKPPINVRDLLEPMRSQCLYRLQGWWGYEFCYGTHVRQFHEEQDKNAPRVQYMLGHFVQSTGNNAEGGTIIKDSEGISAYFVQNYTDGTVCDLTNEPRFTEVRFQCNIQKGDHITFLQETSSCRYLMIIQTPRLCSHPDFHNKAETKAQSINCRIVMDETEWQTYKQSRAKLPKQNLPAKPSHNPFTSNSHPKRSMLQELGEFFGGNTKTVPVNTETPAQQKKSNLNPSSQPSKPTRAGDTEKMQKIIQRLQQEFQKELQEEFGEAYATQQQVQLLALNIPETQFLGAVSSINDNSNENLQETKNSDVSANQDSQPTQQTSSSTGTKQQQQKQKQQQKHHSQKEEL